MLPILLIMSARPGTTPLRADARRNRDAVLSAARQIFAERGLDTPLDVIAREAGVGRATLQRRFPTREDLVRAIFDDNFAELERIATAAVDPADAYVDVIKATVAMLVKDLGFVDVFNSRAVSNEIKQQVIDRFLAIVEDPLRRAKAAGRIRADLQLEDTTLILDMLGAAAHYHGPARPQDRLGRGLALLLDAITPAPA